MFKPIPYQINLEFILGFIPILGIIITGFLKLFKRFNKVLLIIDSSIYSYLRKPAEIEKSTTILVEGIEVNSISKIVIIFSNGGAKTLKKSDFNIFPLIDLIGFTNIINFSIYSSNEFVKILPCKKSESKLELQIDNLEPKAFIKIEILFETIDDDYKPYLKCCLKENEIHEIDLKELRRKKDIDVEHSYGPIMPMTALVLALTIGLTLLFSKYGLGINLSNYKEYDIGWKILFFLPSIIASCVLIYIMMKRINEKYYGDLKVKKWHLFYTNNLLKNNI